jgi:hypothetical protein
MNQSKARVRARGTALCPDFAAMERGVRRMLGRTYQEIQLGQWGWAPTGKSEDVEKSREVAYALADGDLFAGDEETAAWARSVSRKPVTFDPTFAEAPKKSEESGQ